MDTVLFSITNADLAPRVLSSIRRMLKPRAVEPLYPGTTLEEMRRDYFVALSDRSDLADSIATLQQIPGIASVEAPANRRLIASSG